MRAEVTIEAKGDARCLSIAAASVIAKVYRDRVICELDEKYPGYGLRTNMGYPTRVHREALLRLGPTELHRRSFRGVVEVCEDGSDTGLEEDSDYSLL